MKNERPLKYRLRKQDQIYFMHIPKSAGTSFYSILSKQFPEERVWPAHLDRIEHFIDVGLENLANYSVFRSHFDYSIYKIFSRKPVYVTMLREPIKRVISLFRHVWRVEEHLYHDEVVGKQMSLSEFLHHPELYDAVYNRQVRQLAGAKEGDAGHLSDRALLEVAKARLDEFAFFGITERFDDSIHLLCYTFSWDNIGEYDVLNVDPTSTQLKEYPVDVLKEIEDFNQLDLELYSYATEIFDNRVRQMESESGLE